jgi:hypothetical protein
MLMPAPRLARRTTVALAAIALTVVSLVVGPSAVARTDSLPFGGIYSMHRSGYAVVIDGWANDHDTTTPVVVHVRVDNIRVANATANQPTPTHGHRGFSIKVPLTSGPHGVCVRAQNSPDSSQNSLLGCRTINYDYNPKGDFQLVQTPGALTATGWAIDFDAPRQTIGYAIRMDHTQVAHGAADAVDNALSTQFKSAGVNHGFSVTFPVTEGTHRVCLQAFNLGQGSNTVPKCFDPLKVNFSPTGSVTALGQVPGGITIGGYALDPDTTTATSVSVSGAAGTTLGRFQANGAGGPKPGHAFSGTIILPGRALTPGPRTFCVLARNLGKYGEDRSIGCRTANFNWNPTASVTAAVQQGANAVVTGWASDPDTTAPITVRTTVDGKAAGSVVANGTGAAHSGHLFRASITVPSGKHTVCAIGVNTKYGSGDSAPSCTTVTMNLDPYGAFESVARAANGGSNIVAKGWAIDPETTDPINVQVSVDGTVSTVKANVSRPDVASAHPGAGALHGFLTNISELTTDGEHNVCVSAVNVGGGSKATVPLGCKIVNAVNPTVPAAPTHVTAISGYGGAQITWQQSPSDGGAPWTGYVVKALPTGPSITVAPGVFSATLTGLKSATKYTFSVRANNIVGSSIAAVSPAIKTQKAPPPQTSPAPISTSRYIRNITGASRGNLATMHAEGASDAHANPSGHGYLVVLAVGGQDESRQGVILSAGIRYISYGDLVKNLQSYVAGYASQQRPSAPLTIAIATNNDIDVSHSSGVSFANHVIDPVQSYARRYPGITIAGSDDMEPGFRAGYSATKSWLQGYLSATSAPFVFTGSADGCAWSYSGGSCNNGWTMADLYYLTAGAYPVRMINLPQIYNTTMAAQWRYISMTGVRAHHPRINFGGALTEWTACRQARSCGSLTGNSAWRAMWAQLRAEPALRPRSLPYSTDLRIDS